MTPKAERINARLFAAVVIAITLAASLFGDTHAELRAYDRNHDGDLDRAELVAYFVSNDPERENLSDPALRARADDRAVDILTAFRCERCTGISIDAAADLVASVSPSTAKAEREKTKGPCEWWAFKRAVTDAVDPRGAETEFPAVFSYRRDKHKDDTDQLNLLGSVEVVNCRGEIGKLAGGTGGFAPSIELEVDGSTAKNENTIAVGLPVSIEWTRVATAFLPELGVTLTPKVSTDRGFDRRVYEVSGEFWFHSPKLLNAGYLTWFPRTAARNPSATLWWRPRIIAELTNVSDAAGNEDLQKVAGTSLRFGPRIDVVFKPLKLNERLSFGWKFFDRFDNDDSKWRSYSETSAMYDVNEEGTIAITALYRHGRKPPAMGPTDVWLIGIGIKQ